MKRWFELALLLFLAIFLGGMALAQMGQFEEQLGQVENRAGEAGAQQIFEKFGGNPWKGGDPWAQVVDSTPVAFTPRIPGDSTYILIGDFQADKLALCDSCGEGYLCAKNLSLEAPAGTYRAYAVHEAGVFKGIWLELQPSAA